MVITLVVIISLAPSRCAAEGARQYHVSLLVTFNKTLSLLITYLAALPRVQGLLLLLLL